MFEKSFKVVIIKAKMYVKKLKSLQNEPSNSNSRQKAWQVLKSAFVLPLLGKFFVRDLSEKWQRLASRLVPLEVGGTSL